METPSDDLSARLCEDTSSGPPEEGLDHRVKRTRTAATMSFHDAAAMPRAQSRRFITVNKYEKAFEYYTVPGVQIRGKGGFLRMDRTSPLVYVGSEEPVTLVPPLHGDAEARFYGKPPSVDQDDLVARLSDMADAGAFRLALSETAFESELDGNAACDASTPRNARNSGTYPSEPFSAVHQLCETENENLLARVMTMGEAQATLTRAFGVRLAPEPLMQCTRVEFYWHVYEHQISATPHLLQCIAEAKPFFDAGTSTSGVHEVGNPLDEDGVSASETLEYYLVKVANKRRSREQGEGGTATAAEVLKENGSGAAASTETPAPVPETTDTAQEAKTFRAQPLRRLVQAVDESLVAQTGFSLHSLCETPVAQYDLRGFLVRVAYYLAQRVSPRNIFAPSFQSKTARSDGGSRECAEFVSLPLVERPTISVSPQQSQFIAWLTQRESLSFHRAEYSRLHMLRIGPTSWWFDCLQMEIIHPDLALPEASSAFRFPPPKNTTTTATTTRIASIVGEKRKKNNDDDHPPALPLFPLRPLGQPPPPLRQLEGQRRRQRPCVLMNNVCLVSGGWSSGKRTALLAQMLLVDWGWKVDERGRLVHATPSAPSSSSLLHRITAERRTHRSGQQVLCASLRHDERSRPAWNLFENTWRDFTAQKPSSLSPQDVQQALQKSPTASRTWSAIVSRATLVLTDDADRWLSALDALGRSTGMRVARGESAGRRYYFWSSPMATAPLRCLYVVRCLDDYLRLTLADLAVIDVLVCSYHVLGALGLSTCAYMAPFRAVLLRHANAMTNVTSGENDDDDDDEDPDLLDPLDTGSNMPPSFHRLAFRAKPWMTCVRHAMNPVQVKSTDHVLHLLEENNSYESHMTATGTENLVPLEAVRWHRIVVDNWDLYREQSHLRAKQRGGAGAPAHAGATVLRFLDTVAYERLVAVSTDPIHANTMRMHFIHLLHRHTRLNSIYAGYSVLYEGFLHEAARTFSSPADMRPVKVTRKQHHERWPGIPVTAGIQPRILAVRMGLVHRTQLTVLANALAHLHTLGTMGLENASQLEPGSRLRTNADGDHVASLQESSFRAVGVPVSMATVVPTVGTSVRRSAFGVLELLGVDVLKAEYHQTRSVFADQDRGTAHRFRLHIAWPSSAVDAGRDQPFVAWRTWRPSFVYLLWACTQCPSLIPVVLRSVLDQVAYRGGRLLSHASDDPTQTLPVVLSSFSSRSVRDAVEEAEATAAVSDPAPAAASVSVPARTTAPANVQNNGTSLVFRLVSRTSADATTTTTTEAAAEETDHMELDSESGAAISGGNGRDMDDDDDDDDEDANATSDGDDDSDDDDWILGQDDDGMDWDSEEESSADDGDDDSEDGDEDGEDDDEDEDQDVGPVADLVRLVGSALSETVNVTDNHRITFATNPSDENDGAELNRARFQIFDGTERQTGQPVTVMFQLPDERNGPLAEQFATRLEELLSISDIPAADTGSILERLANGIRQMVSQTPPTSDVEWSSRPLLETPPASHPVVASALGGRATFTTTTSRGRIIHTSGCTGRNHARCSGNACARIGLLAPRGVDLDSNTLVAPMRCVSTSSFPRVAYHLCEVLRSPPAPWPGGGALTSVEGGSVAVTPLRATASSPDNIPSAAPLGGGLPSGSSLRDICVHSTVTIHDRAILAAVDRIFNEDVTTNRDAPLETEWKAPEEGGLLSDLTTSGTGTVSIAARAHMSDENSHTRQILTGTRRFTPVGGDDLSALCDEYIQSWRRRRQKRTLPDAETGVPATNGDVDASVVATAVNAENGASTPTVEGRPAVETPGTGSGAVVLGSPSTAQGATTTTLPLPPPSDALVSTSLPETIQDLRATTEGMLRRYAHTLRLLVQERNDACHFLMTQISLLTQAIRPTCFALFSDAETASFLGALSAPPPPPSASDQDTTVDAPALKTWLERGREAYDFFTNRLDPNIRRHSLASATTTAGGGHSSSVVFLRNMIIKFHYETTWLERDIQFIRSQRERVVANERALDRSIRRLLTTVVDDHQNADTAADSSVGCAGADEDCSICCNPVRSSEYVAVYPCGHMFCWPCHVDVGSATLCKVTDHQRGDEAVDIAWRGIRCAKCMYVVQRGERIRAVATSPPSPSTRGSTTPAVMEEPTPPSTTPVSAPPAEDFPAGRLPATAGVAAKNPTKGGSTSAVRPDVLPDLFRRRENDESAPAYPKILSVVQWLVSHTRREYAAHRSMLQYVVVSQSRSALCELTRALRTHNTSGPNHNVKNNAAATSVYNNNNRVRLFPHPYAGSDYDVRAAHEASVTAFLSASASGSFGGDGDAGTPTAAAIVWTVHLDTYYRAAHPLCVPLLACGSGVDAVLMLEPVLVRVNDARASNRVSAAVEQRLLSRFVHPFTGRYRTPVYRVLYADHALEVSLYNTASHPLHRHSVQPNRRRYGVGGTFFLPDDETRPDNDCDEAIERRRSEALLHAIYRDRTTKFDNGGSPSSDSSSHPGAACMQTTIEWADSS